MRGLRRLLLGLGMLLCLQQGPAAASPADPLPYVRPPQLSYVRISPSGQHMVVLMTSQSGRRVAAVASLDKPGEFKAVAAFSNANVDTIHWVNDKRLVYSGSQPGYLIQPGGAGIFAVDLDGENVRQLVSWVDTTEQTGTRIQTRMLPYGWFLHDTLDDGSDDVLMVRPTATATGELIASQLVRLNTATGQTRTISRGAPLNATGWLLDPQGELRVVQVVHDGRTRLHWLPPGSQEWQLVDDRPDWAEDSLQPLALEGPEQLLVLTRNGKDTADLHAYDLRARRLDPQPIVAIAGYDLNPGLIMNRRNGTLMGLVTTAEQPVPVWFDERMAKLQRQVDAAMPPGRYNQLLCGRCQGGRHVVIRSHSDREPGELMLLDTGSMRLTRLGRMRPELTEASQGRRTFHRVPARDGLPLPVVMTHPPGRDAKEPLPTVMLVHGGPWVRGSSRLWNGEAQFLASRGWRVLEVEFRGSTGFGWKHFRAGWHQWGLAMQDDLVDALDWAIKEGWVAPNRACIAGSSYGGYAALMGPIRHPQAWRCVASHAGVTDIDLMFTATWSDASEQIKRYSLRTLVGDPQKDAERLKATSPLQRVAEIKVPVLLAQGLYDRRVPVEHGNRFVAAARRAGVDVRRVDYEEGHTWVDTGHHVDFLRRLEAMVAKAVSAP